MGNLMGTTICAVKRDGHIAIAGDGQVTIGQNTIFKTSAHTVRRIFNDQEVIGFAGSVADGRARACWSCQTNRSHGPSLRAPGRYGRSPWAGAAPSPSPEQLAAGNRKAQVQTVRNRRAARVTGASGVSARAR